MSRIGSLFLVVIGLTLLGSPTRLFAQVKDIPALVARIHKVAPLGEGHKDAMQAWKSLAQADATQLPEVLAGLDQAGPLATNWIRAAAETVAGRTVKNGGKLPVAALENFLHDTSHAPRARRLAYELIATVNNDAESRLIPGLLNDPSLELRRDAVALVIEQAAAAAKEDKAASAALYRKAFTAARDLDQIKACVEKLKGLDEKVDLPVHFGFVMNWHLVAPFDNKAGKGFDVAYPPEAGVDLKATYAGEEGKNVAWVAHTTTESYGIVDLNKALEKHKGAIAYCYAEFVAVKDQPIDLRLGTPNANKVWLNGELIFTNKIYHSGREVDQYVGQGKLKKGKNEILLKIAQNEQTENWAQDWQFQFRVCDQIGTAVLSLDRQPTQTANR